jgi:hypothetical protein
VFYGREEELTKVCILKVAKYKQKRCYCGRPVQGDVIRDRAVDCLKFIPYKHYI